MKNEEIKERAKKILEKYDINCMNDEKEIIETLDDIINKSDLTDRDEKTLNSIEKYLSVKSKLMANELAYEYLRKMSERMNIQKVRKGDRIAYQVVLFKVKDIDGIEHYSLTREELNEEIQNNPKAFGNSPTVKIDSQENTELYNLLEMIKKMF